MVREDGKSVVASSRTNDADSSGVRSRDAQASYRFLPLPLLLPLPLHPPLPLCRAKRPTYRPTSISTSINRRSLSRGMLISAEYTSNIHTIDCNSATRILRSSASGYFIFAPLAQITTTVNGWPDEARRFLVSSLVAPLDGPSPFRSYRIIRLSVRYMYTYTLG